MRAWSVFSINGVLRSATRPTASATGARIGSCDGMPTSKRIRNASSLPCRAKLPRPAAARAQQILIARIVVGEDQHLLQISDVRRSNCRRAGRWPPQSRVGINSIGTLILVGGLIYSVVRYRRAGAHRNRMIGCLLIAGGTIAVALGGTLTRFGSDQYLYIAMSIGIALIFSGYLAASRRTDSQSGKGAVRHGGGVEQTRSRPAETGLTGLATQDGLLPPARIFSRPGLGLPGSGIASAVDSPGVAFIESRLDTLSDAELAEECRVWSVPPRTSTPSAGPRRAGSGRSAID